MRLVLLGALLVGCTISDGAASEPTPFQRLDDVVGLIQGETDPVRRYDLGSQLPALMDLLDDTDGSDSRLVAIGELLTLVRNRDVYDVDVWAADALGSAGSKARIAIPKLRGLLQKFRQEQSSMITASLLDGVEVVCRALSRIAPAQEFELITECRGRVQAP